METLISLSLKSTRLCARCFTDLWIYRDKLSDKVVVKAYLLACVRKRITRSQERDRIFRLSSSVDTIEFFI
jgi:hypothetical protein